MRDAERAIAAAEMTNSHRLAFEGLVHLQYAGLEATRYQVRSNLDRKLMTREASLLFVQEQQQQSQRVIEAAKTDFLQTQPQSLEWVEKEMQPNIDKIHEQWDDLVRSCKMETFYSAVTEEDVRSFRFLPILGFTALLFRTERSFHNSAAASSRE